MLKRFLLGVSLTLFTAIPLSAQTVGGVADRIAFEIAGPSLAEVQAYTYRAYLDNTPASVLPVTCAAGPASGVFTCISNEPLPAITLGAHTLQLSAANQAGEGTRSAVFNFTIIAVPQAPSGVRLVQAGN